MLIDLNPLHLFEKRPKTLPKISALSIAIPEQPAKAVEVTPVANKFISVLEAIGKDFLKGLQWAVTYAVPVEKLVALLFPAAAPVAAGVADATTLIQNAVLLVEQKYAASGVQTGTGSQKLAEVLTLTSQAVTSLLAQTGVSADTAYITSLINAVVAILNVQQSAVPAA